MATAPTRRSWLHRLRGEQWAAAGIAIALNVAAVWLLAQDEAPQLRKQTGDDHVIQLVFLKPAPEPVATRLTVVIHPRPNKLTARPSPPRTSPAQTTKSVVSRPLQVADSAIGSATTERPLDLSIREAAMSFERKPLAEKVAPISEAPIRMPLAFTDRSFGGTMQRMTMQSICRELRAALISSPQSASSVMASMREQGCKF